MPLCPYLETRSQFKQWAKGDEKLIPGLNHDCQVEHLHFNSDQASALDMPSWAEKIRRLKSFSLCCKMSPVEVDRQAYYDMGSLLAEHSTTLEYVSLRDARMCLLPGGISTFHYLSNADGLRYIDFSPIDFLPPIRVPEPRNYPAAFPLCNMLQGLPTGIDRLSLCPNDRAHYFDFCGIIGGFADALQARASSIKTLLPALKEIEVVGWHPFVGIFPCQTEMSGLQEAFGKEDIVFVSTPRTDIHTDEDIFCLEYVEKDWVWVQPFGKISTSCRWTQAPALVGTNFNFGWTISTQLFDDDDDLREWLVVTVSNQDYGKTPSGMDQYLVEQSAWYWEELQDRKRTAAHSIQTKALDRN
jgi:hypothetical protein